MRKFLISILGVLIVLTLTLILILQFAPGLTLSGLQSTAAWSAGFEKKSADIDGYAAHHYEAGPEDAPVVVLLHGLTDEKNSFVLAASDLAKSHRVILPDLQGHGENAQTNGRDYSIRGQAEFVENLLKALDVDQLVIGGNSMGGHVAIAFTMANTDRVEKLVLLGATGLLLDEPTTYFTFPEDIDLAYLKAMHENSLKNPPYLPESILRHLARDLNEKAPFYNQMVSQLIAGEDFRLDDRIENLTTPTLVVWGREDQVVPLRYGQAYDAELPNSKLIILEAGHAPQIEIPDTVSAELLHFIE